MVDLERIQRLAEKLGNRRDSLEIVRQMRCGGKKYPGGGKFFRTNLQNESPLMYQPMVDINYPIVPPLRFRPQPDLGDYQAPASTGMVVNYPISLPERVPVVIQSGASAPVAVEVPADNLFTDEMIARRALKQRYAESAFDDKAKSHAGAQGAWQIMPITLKDYLGRGRGKAGDLNDPEYNRKVRDWVMGIIPRDLKEFWSDSDSDRAKLAKLYAAYNWGAGNLRSFLRKKRDAGVDISNPDNWVDDLNPETRRYVKYLAFDEDIPDSIYTNSAFEDAARARGYMAEGGNLYEMGGPEKQNWFTRMMLNSVMNDPYTGAVATASGWTRDKEGNVTQTEEAANSEGAKRLRSALAEIAAMPLADLVVDVAGAAVVGTKTYKSIKLARELNKMLKAGEFDAAVDMAREASKAEPIVKASTTLPAGYPSSSDYSLTRVPSSLPITEQPANLVSLPNYAGQVEDAIKAGKWGNLRFYRNIDGVPYTTDSGLIRLGKDENALVNVTSDLPFRLHSSYKAAPGAEYLVIDPEAFVGKTPLSIEPMDTFFPNVGMDIDPKYVKIITGNKGIIPEIEAKGMEALTSPELQELYSKIGGDFGSDAAAAYRDAVDKYITENIGRPSLVDYAHLEEVTGLKSGTVPLSEQKAYSAAKQASKEIEDTYDWMSKMGLDSGKYFRGLSDDVRWPYTHANGRDVPAISFSEEPIIGPGGNVFYDTAPPVEAGLMESLGSYSHPNIDRLDSILEYTLDPNGYHYFDPQLGKTGFILPSPIRASGGKIHIKPEEQEAMRVERANRHHIEVEKARNRGKMSSYISELRKNAKIQTGGATAGANAYQADFEGNFSQEGKELGEALNKYFAGKISDGEHYIGQVPDFSKIESVEDAGKVAKFLRENNIISPDTDLPWDITSLYWASGDTSGAGNTAHHMLNSVPSGFSLRIGSLSGDSVPLALKGALTNYGTGPGQFTVTPAGREHSLNGMQMSALEGINPDGTAIFTQPGMIRRFGNFNPDTRLFTPEEAAEILGYINSGDFNAIRPEYVTRYQAAVDAVDRASAERINAVIRQINERNAELGLPQLDMARSSRTRTVGFDERYKSRDELWRPGFRNMKHKYGGIMNRINSVYKNDNDRIRQAIANARSRQKK